MNAPFVQHHATRLATDVQQATDKDVERLQLLFRAVLSRNPRSEEQSATLRFLEGQGDAGWRQLAHALILSNEFMYVD